MGNNMVFGHYVLRHWKWLWVRWWIFSWLFECFFFSVFSMYENRIRVKMPFSHKFIISHTITTLFLSFLHTLKTLSFSWNTPNRTQLCPGFLRKFEVCDCHSKCRLPMRDSFSFDKDKYWRPDEIIEMKCVHGQEIIKKEYRRFCCFVRRCNRTMDFHQKKWTAREKESEQFGLRMIFSKYTCNLALW